MWLLVLFISYTTFMAPWSWWEGLVRCDLWTFCAKAVFWGQYVRPLEACCFHIALGFACACIAHWIRRRSFFKKGSVVVFSAKDFRRNLVLAEGNFWRMWSLHSLHRLPLDTTSSAIKNNEGDPCKVDPLPYKRTCGVLLQMASHHEHPHPERCKGFWRPSSTSLGTLAMLCVFFFWKIVEVYTCSKFSSCEQDRTHDSQKDRWSFNNILQSNHVLCLRWPRGRTPKPITCEKGPSRAIHSQQLHDFLDFFQNYIGRLWRVLGGIFWCNKMMRPWNLCRFLCGVDLRNLHHSTLMCWFESHICLEFIVGSVFDFFWHFCMSMCRWLSGSRTTYYATWPQHKRVGGSSELKPDYDNVKTVKR